MVTGSCQVRLKRKCKERWSQEIETIIPCHTIPYQQTYQHTLPYLTLPYITLHFLTLPYVITFCYVMLRYIYIYIYSCVYIYTYTQRYPTCTPYHIYVPSLHVAKRQETHLAGSPGRCSELGGPKK